MFFQELGRSETHWAVQSSRYSVIPEEETALFCFLFFLCTFISPRAGPPGIQPGLRLNCSSRQRFKSISSQSLICPGESAFARLNFFFKRGFSQKWHKKHFGFPKETSSEQFLKLWRIFKKSEEPFSIIKNLLCEGKIPWMLKVLHGTFVACKELLFRVCPSFDLFKIYLTVVKQRLFSRTDVQDVFSWHLSVTSLILWNSNDFL